MEAVIIAGFFRTTNLILQPQNDRFGIRNGKWFHANMKPCPPLCAIIYDAKIWLCASPEIR